MRVPIENAIVLADPRFVRALPMLRVPNDAKPSRVSRSVAPPGTLA